MHRMERHWYIKRCRLFERLTPEQLAQLERQSRQKTFARGNSVYLPSDSAAGVLLVAEGRIRLSSLTPDGKQAILAFVEPGEVFGELALLDAGAREEYAEAVAASTVILLPGDLLQQFLMESPHFSLGITRLIGLRRRRVERRLKSLLFRSTRERLGSLLLELVEQYGRPVPEGILIDLKLSHQDLASIIGATRESVTLLLGELQSEGLVVVSRQRVVVCSPARLAHNMGLPAPEPPSPAWPPHSAGTSTARPAVDSSG